MTNTGRGLRKDPNSSTVQGINGIGVFQTRPIPSALNRFLSSFMKLQYFLLPAALWVTSSLVAREFTDPYGRKIDAEMVSVAGDRVTLKLNATEKEYTIPLTGLSEADQVFVKQWAKDNPSAVNFRFRVLADPVIEGKVVGKNEAVNKPGEVKYRITVYNQSGQEVTNVKVRYKIMCKDFVYTSSSSSRYVYKRSAPVIQAVAGEVAAEAIPLDGRAEFVTKAYNVQAYKRSSYYSSGGAKTIDQLQGAMVQVLVGDQVVDEVKFGIRDSMPDITWESDSGAAKKNDRGRDGEGEKKTTPDTIIIK